MAKGIALSRRKQETHGGRVAAMDSYASRIRANLELILRRHHDGTKARFYDRVGVSQGTGKKWFKTGKMEMYYASIIAREYNVSLNWFLLGVGPERLLGKTVERNVSADLRQMVMDALPETFENEGESRLRADADAFFISGRDLSAEAVRHLVEDFARHRHLQRLDVMRKTYRLGAASGEKEFRFFDETKLDGLPVLEWLTEVQRMYADENRVKRWRIRAKRR